MIKKLLAIVVLVMLSTNAISQDINNLILSCLTKSNTIKVDNVEPTLEIFGKINETKFFKFKKADIGYEAHSGWDEINKRFKYWHNVEQVGNKFIIFKTIPGSNFDKHIQLLDRETGEMFRKDRYGKLENYLSECKKIAESDLPTKKVKQLF